MPCALTLTNGNACPTLYRFGNLSYPSPCFLCQILSYYLILPNFTQSEVRLSIYDATGRVVARLNEGIETAGWRQTVWNGHGAATGLYIVRLEAEGTIRMNKVMLVR